MATPTIEGELADFALAAYNSNPNFIEGVLAKGEGELRAFVVGVLQNTKAGGLAGIILKYVEGGEEAFAAQLIAKYTPEQLYTLIGGWLTTEAKVLGG
jgi:hypothetical protein